MSDSSLGELKDNVVDDYRNNTLATEESEMPTDGTYGGMPTAIYDAIVHYKKTGSYPPFSDQRIDRSAHAHWRMRCSRFLLSEEDNETLLYYNEQSANMEPPRIVVKKGEVRSIIQRIHEMIGHLGTKRTQYAVLKRLYWRSVRADVRMFLNSCEVCLKKKADGKKVIKAEVDIIGGDFDIDVTLRPIEERSEYADRFILALNGVDENTIKRQNQAAVSSYTFREARSSGSQRRNTSLKKVNSTHSNKSKCRRPPLRSFCSGASQMQLRSSAARDPLNHPSPSYGNSFDENVDEAMSDERAGISPTLGAVVGYDELSCASSSFGRPSSHFHDDFHISEPTELAICEDIELPCASDSCQMSQNQQYKTANSVEPGGHLPDSTAETSSHLTCFACGHAVDPSSSQNVVANERLATSAEEVQNSPAFTGIAPVLLMPSSDPEIVQLQKELLLRQKSIQLLQEKVLREEYEYFRSARQRDNSCHRGLEIIEDDRMLHPHSDLSYPTSGGHVIDDKASRIVRSDDRWP